jgi:hypothetical protein
MFIVVQSEEVVGLVGAVVVVAEAVKLVPPFVDLRIAEVALPLASLSVPAIA